MLSGTSGSMRAAVYRGVARVEVEELPTPELEPGEILVRVHTCGVCGTDLKKIRHGLVPPPRVFGHETAGTVARIAPGETEWQVGDRVVVQHHVPCRTAGCYYCERRLYANCPGYKRTGCTAGFEPAGGGFAEYVRVLPFVRAGVVRIPDKISFEEASFLEPLNTVLKGALSVQPELGGIGLVIGQGPIGLLFTQAFRLREAEVVASDPFEGRRELARRWGARPVDPSHTDVPALCRELTCGRGADFAVVAVATTRVIGDALRAVRPGGSVLLFAQTKLDDPAEIDAGQIGALEKKLVGSYSSDIDLQPLAAEWLFGRRIETAPLVTHRFPLADIGVALALASHPTGESLKIVVQP
jgi:L-iditol 2-dehydrogenase